MNPFKLFSAFNNVDSKIYVDYTRKSTLPRISAFERIFWTSIMIACAMGFSSLAKGQGEDLRRSYSVNVSNLAPTSKVFQSVKNTWFKGNGRHIVEMKNTFKIGQNVSSINSEMVKHSDFKEGFIRDFKTLTATTIRNDDFKFIVVTLKDGVIVSICLCRNLERNALRDFILFE